MKRVSYFKKSVFASAVIWLSGWFILAGVEIIFRLIKGPQPLLSTTLVTAIVYGLAGLGIGFSLGFFSSLLFGMGRKELTQLGVKSFCMASCIAAIIFLYGISLVNKLRFFGTAGFFFFCLFVLIALYLFFSRAIRKSHLYSSFLAISLSLDLLMIGGLYVNEKFLPGKFLSFNLISIVGNGGIIISCILFYFLLYYVFRFLSVKLARFFQLSTTIVALTALLIVGAIGWYIYSDSVPRVPSPQPAPQLEGKPNVILITMDTTRADHLSCYGYDRKTTPHLDKFAEESLLFENAYSTASWTLPAHASIFTGLYPSKHGAHGSMDVLVWDLGNKLSDQFTTLAELLQAEGYITAGVIGGPYCSSHFGLDQGFDYYSDDLLNVKPDLDYFMLYKIIGKFIPLKDLTFRYGYSGTRIACQINTIVFSWLDKNYTHPFFLFINYFDVHGPFVAPHPYDTLYEGKNKEIIRGPGKKGKEINYSVREWSLIRSVLSGKHTLSEKEREHFISQYDGKITCLDYHMERLFQKLKKLKTYDQTMIIIASDHGESFGEHHLMFHNLALYDNLLKVPLIIKYPLSMKRIGTVEHQVSLVDILPEILTTLGISTSDSVHQGIPLSDVNQRPIVAENYGQEFFAKLSPARFDRDLRTIIKDNFKYIWASNGKNELYDLSKDPQEMNNMIAEFPRKAKELHTSLNSFSFSDRDIAPQKEPAGMDEKIRENLRALGYVE